VEHPGRPLATIEGVINMDTVGRLNSQPVSVLGTGTASEWQHIFRGASFVTGVESRSVPDSMEASDQMSFIERGVPGVQLFTGAHTDYHRPADTPDKIDVAGLAKVAALAKEAIVYLAERPEPLTVTIKAGGGGPTAPAAPGQAGSRRVSLGTVPDFAYQGPGVRVSGTVDGSAAAAAGIREGDVLLAIEDRRIANLQDLSNILRTLTAGRQVRVEINRSGRTMTVTVTVKER
jgi:membrane-associated protease RseP (regulator of RpoE activity)